MMGASGRIGPAVAVLFAAAMGVAAAQVSGGLRCGKSSLFDDAEFFSCPRPYDDRDEVFCCQGLTGNGYCCDADEFHDRDWGDTIGDSSSSEFDNGLFEPLPEPEKRSIVRGIAKLVGIVIAAVVFVAAVCILCCCCCPFCLLAKKRQRGQVLRETGGGQVNDNQGGQPAYPQQPQAAGYMMQQQQQAMLPPQQPQGYPPPAGGYPAAGYPPQPQPAMAAGYPPYPDNPPPYPGPAEPQQPVMMQDYTQKQPSFNPGYN